MQLREHSGPFHCARAQDMAFIILELSSSSLIICACFSCLACFLCVSKIQFLPEYHGSPADAAAAASECLCKITSGPTPGFVETFAGLLDKDTKKCRLLINFPPKYCHHSERLGGRIMKESQRLFGDHQNFVASSSTQDSQLASQLRKELIFVS